MAEIFDQPTPRTEFMLDLYRRYADDLRQTREHQRNIYRENPLPLFDDVEGEWLYLLIRYLSEEHPVTALEVGSGTGFSTGWMLNAMRDAHAGHLTSLDLNVNTRKFIPHDLSNGRWTFYQQDVLTFPPETYDFMLIDSNHDSPIVEQILDLLLPCVRSGGFIGVHDIYMLPTPRQGEALHVFKHLDAISVRPFTPAACFLESWQAIQAERAALNLDHRIHSSDLNSVLLFQVP
jgi:predicted O-methyltransferase YrrM